MQQLMFKSCHLIITLKLKIDKKIPALVTLMDLLNKKIHFKVSQITLLCKCLENCVLTALLLLLLSTLNPTWIEGKEAKKRVFYFNNPSLKQR